jgi:two-component system response regulator AtoC
VTGASENSRGIAHRHVLVVEDELLIRWSIVETLTNAGCLVTEAPDGATALRALSESAGSVDAVVLDYRLPDSNDLGLLTSIRRVSPRSAVVMMTAFGTPEVFAAALALGASRIIEKPFEMHDLEAMIVEACAPLPGSSPW